MSEEAWKKRYSLPFLCHSSLRHPPCLGPFFPSLIQESTACLSSLNIIRDRCRPASFLSSHYRSEEKAGSRKEKGVLRALCPTHLTCSRGSPVPPTRLKEKSIQRCAFSGGCAVPIGLGPSP
ncbi:hypothetical protein E5676_scaffold84371G00010 [Cucumis melo var. makuwa]|uniref:Uncharacterized protein n=1 Tax=Cucumis melo var. makuwa TaxID=1194695 RepID=A0A5D3C8J3_CUCMM|nr:hypothetical protein E5676_scaffold84371G00010 [Cucumis melo var. makuwa]